MNTYLMKKAIIEAAVSRGIKEMEEDPERSVRRLADLGRQFSKNRFQDQVFSVMQELLNNENSAYYDMVANLLKNSDHESMKKFGVNFGYMSWAYGASMIRKEEESKGFCIPWSIMFQYDSTREDGLSIERLAPILEQGMDLGIYAYFIRECAGSTESYELLELLEKYKDAAFVWIRESGRLTAAQIQMLKVCKNTVVSLPIEDPESLLTAALLRDQKVIFAMHLNYDNGVCPEVISPIMENVLTSETSLFFLIPETGTDPAVQERVQKFCYESRLRQDYPCCLMDYTGDGKSISKVLVEHGELLEIGADGRIILPDGSLGEAFPFELPLADALSKIMPPYTPKKSR